MTATRYSGDLRLRISRTKKYDGRVRKRWQLTSNNVYKCTIEYIGQKVSCGAQTCDEHKQPRPYTMYVDMGSSLLQCTPRPYVYDDVALTALAHVGWPVTLYAQKNEDGTFVVKLRRAPIEPEAPALQGKEKKPAPLPIDCRFIASIDRQHVYLRQDDVVRLIREAAEKDYDKDTDTVCANVLALADTLERVEP